MTSNGAPTRGEQPTLYQQMGGPSGLILSSIPILVVVFGTKRYGLGPTLIAALVVAAAYFCYCLVAKKSLQPAISGFIGVGIGAAIAWYTGDAKGFFLYGIWMSAVYAALFFLSIALRWPAVAVIWLGINGQGMAWRRVKPAMKFYDLATACWAVVFLARFVVQRWLYDVGSADVLGVVKIAMGWPLTILAVAITMWMVKKARHAITEYERATGTIILPVDAPAPQVPETTGQDSAIASQDKTL